MPRAPTRTTATAFAGTWRITETEVWDADALDTMQPAFIKFDEESIGSFGMIVISAGIDCRFGTRDGSRWSSARSTETTTGIPALGAPGG